MIRPVLLQQKKKKLLSNVQVVIPKFDCTLNNGQEDDDDEEEEGNVKDDAVDFVLVAVRRLNLVADAATRSYALVQVKDEALKEQI